MAQARFRGYRMAMVVALVLAGVLTGVGLRPAAAQVTAVRGSALGYVANVSIINSPVNTRGPAPTVTLPAGGSATPVTATEPSARAVIGPATIFTSGPLEVSTQGTPAGGSVTSSSKVSNLNTSQQETLTAAAAQSTCTASGTGVSGTTTITNGILQTDSGLDVNSDGDYTDAGEHAPVNVAVPSNPGPNTVIPGHVHIGEVTDNFEYVFNERITNADGSLTVNAAHQRFLGPAAVGDLVIGQSVCGVTGTAATTTTTAPGASTTSTAPGATTTTTAPAATTTTTPVTTTTTASASTTTTSASTTTTGPAGSTTLAGGAYGYFTSVALFGGAPATRGPEPAVTLPATGADPPLTATAASGRAAYGPAEIFTSGRIEVSTQGTPGPAGSVRSSSALTDVGPGPLIAQTLTSTCSASPTAQTASVTIAGGKLTTSEGANLDSEADDTIVNLPANPAVNTSFEGKLEGIGDSFRIVLNEQTRSSGSITVNAAHMYLLGPTAVGEAIIGQSRCGATATTSSGPGGSGSVIAAGGMARTGSDPAPLVALAIALAAVGSAVTYSGGRLVRRKLRAMPWSKRSLLR
jgi:hypothetical protein